MMINLIIKPLFKRLVVLGSFAGLFCLGVFQGQVFSDDIFKLMDMDPIKINVKNLEIKDLYRAPLEDPFVEHRMRKSPSEALISWAHTILRPVGSEGLATFSIIESSAMLSNISSDFKFLDLFKNNQSSKITIKLIGKLEISKDNNNQTGYLDILSTSYKTAPESASINLLENIWDKNLNIAVGKFDSKFRQEIKALSHFLK